MINPVRLAKRALRTATVIGLMMPVVASIGVILFFFAHDGDVQY